MLEQTHVWPFACTWYSSVISNSAPNTMVYNVCKIISRLLITHNLSFGSETESKLVLESIEWKDIEQYLLKDKNTDKVGKDEVEKACQGVFRPEEVQEGLKKLADLGAITAKVDPESKEPEFKLMDDQKEVNDEKLMPILKDLKKDKEDGKVKKDDVFKACDGKIDLEGIEDDLKKLDDLGVISPEVNPKTKQEEIAIFDPKEDYKEP